MGNREFRTKSSGLLVALGSTFVLAVAFAALWVIAEKVDVEAREREQAQVAHGFAGWIEEIEGRIVGQVIWDDAVLNLGVAYNQEWAHTNVGQFFHGMTNLEQAFVLNASDSPIYGMVGGKDVTARPYMPLAKAAAPLVSQVRRLESERAPIRPAPPFTEMVSQPIQSSSVAIIGGKPAILTATLVQPDFGKVATPERAPVVVTVEELNAEFLARFADRFLLSDFALQTRETGVAAISAKYAIRGQDAEPVAWLSWKPQTPGSLLLWNAAGPLLVLLGLLLVGTYSLFRQARRGAEALIASEARSNFIAFHDHLTGLPNRALLQDRLHMAIAGLQRGGSRFGVFLIDLDRFKQVNDCYGHAAGDKLIVEVSARLQGLVRENDTICRLGGDEFAILCQSSDARGMATLAQRIVDSLSQPFDLPFARVFVGASIGVTVVGEANADAGEALRQADLAMYAAKEIGGSRYRFFEAEMDQALKSRQKIEADLREALDNGSLSMVYQPQTDADGQTFGVEALLRWHHPERGEVSPAHFVAIAEEGGLIEELGTYTFRQAFADSLRWPDLMLSVNVSAIQLRSTSFLSLLQGIVEETGAAPRRIELEITEGVLLDDDLATHETLLKLREMGFRIALDDFGTGYSSLSYLRKYPVDKVKIDRSFITGLGHDRESEAVVGAIVKLARALSLEVIAEGVETRAQLAGLRRAGCNELQGYLHSRPMPAERIADFLLDEAANLGARAKLTARA